MSVIQYKPDNLTTLMPVITGTVINTGDFLYYNSATNAVKPASSQTDALSEPLNQAVFAQNFAGVALGRQTAAMPTGTILVATDFKVYLDAVSGTYNVGDPVSLAENAGGDALENAKVTASSASSAIGVVTETTTASSTKVWAYFRSKFANGDMTPAPLDSTVTTASGNITLTVESDSIQAIDPNGSGRTVTLPNEAASKNRVFYIVNTADAAEILTVKASNGSTTICTPTQSETAILFCDGTAWRGVVGANN